MNVQSRQIEAIAGSRISDLEEARVPIPYTEVVAPVSDISGAHSGTWVIA